MGKSVRKALALVADRGTERESVVPLEVVYVRLIIIVDKHRHAIYCGSSGLPSFSAKVPDCGTANGIDVCIASFHVTLRAAPSWA